MIELFIALFGILYFVGRLGSEKLSKIDYEQKKKARNDWQASVSDKSLELRLADQLRDRGEAREALMREVSLAFQEMPLNHDASHVCLPDSDYLRILLARRGKIPILEKGCMGVYVRNLNPGAFERQKEMMLWVERELKKHGVKADLVAAPSHAGHRAVLARSLRYHRGYLQYYWNEPGELSSFEIVDDVDKVFGV